MTCPLYQGAGVEQFTFVAGFAGRKSLRHCSKRQRDTTTASLLTSMLALRHLTSCSCSSLLTQYLTVHSFCLPTLSSFLAQRLKMAVPAWTDLHFEAPPRFCSSAMPLPRTRASARANNSAMSLSCRSINVTLHRLYHYTIPLIAWSSLGFLC